MLFNTLNFFIFFFIVFSVSYIFRKKPLVRYSILLIASYYFYAYWNAEYLLLILLSTILDYTLAIMIENAKKKSIKLSLLYVSIFSNLTILAIFKYYNFFIDSIHSLFLNIGLPFQYTTLEVLLPVGISFYTFQSMSYSIDVYKKEVKVEKDFIRFALYISFFPQLVAGPIVRAKDFLPQLGKKYNLTKREFFYGMGLIWIGLFKKSVLADFFAKYSDAYFTTLDIGHSIYELLIGVYSFAMQIYFDFSGYTDTAIGVALLLGFKIPKNFNYPYASDSLSDFWRRWHISLSSWFRDYVYIPMGGNRKRKSRNLIATLSLSGLWHGAAWPFVLWGVFHGVLLALETTIIKKLSWDIPLVIKRLFIFQIICLGWFIFRLETFSDIYLVFENLSFSIPSLTVGHLLAIFGVAIIVTYQHNHLKLSIIENLTKLHYSYQIIIHVMLLIITFSLGSFGNPFIYFQF